MPFAELISRLELLANEIARSERVSKEQKQQLVGMTDLLVESYRRLESWIKIQMSDV